MSTQFQYSNGTLTTLETSGSALTSGNAVLATTAYDNSNTSNAFFYGDLELQVTFTSAPTAGQVVEVYLTPAVDGTNYTDTDNTTPNFSLLVGSFVCRAVTTAQRITIRGVVLPPSLFKAYLRNQTSQSMPSGWILKLLPYREVGV